MSRYEQRMAADKAEIRRRVAAAGRSVEGAVARAVDGLLRRDRKLCYQVILGDLPITRELRAIDARCHAFVARHLPSAGHLRFVSSVLQMDVAVERIGDYAATIAREAVQLSKSPPTAIAADIRSMSQLACAVLAQATTAFAEKDVELARETRAQAKTVEHTYGRVFRFLAREGGTLPLIDAFALLTVINNLERVSDQAKNISEETIFELTGEAKAPKRYRVLFVDARDTMIAPLATALARKAFPESGVYEDVGYSPGETLAPELRTLAKELSLDLTDIRPAALSQGTAALGVYHVVVCLAGDAARHLEGLPYATVLLEWNLPQLADAVGQDADGSVRQQLRHVGKQLGDEIRERMTTMRGEDAR
ncbi:MAG: PhoU domain-containing protein [Nannocystaceae bacterium]